MRRTEPHSPWQNQAEGMIGETKKRWKTKMSAKRSERTRLLILTTMATS
jgi:hypothetical protein